MKVWQRIVSEHNNIEVVDDSKIIVLDVIYEPSTKLVSNDTVTRMENGYIDSENNSYDTIYEYLGY